MLIILPGTRLDLVDEAIDTGNTLDALSCKLFKQGYTPSINSTLAELDAVEANFTGYAEFTPVVWSAAYLDANKTAYTLGGLIEFAAGPPTPPAAFVPNNIGGYYLYNGTTLKGVELFTNPSTGLAAPISVANENGLVPVIPRYSYGQ